MYPNYFPIKLGENKSCWIFRAGRIDEITYEVRVGWKRERSPVASNTKKESAKEAMLKVFLRGPPLFFTSDAPIPPSPSLLHTQCLLCVHTRAYVHIHIH